MRDRPLPEHAGAWTRRRLLVHVGAVVIVGVLLVAGLGLSLHRGLQSGDATPNAEGDVLGASSPSQSEPYPSVDADAALPGRLSTGQPGTMLVPPATRLGAAGVPSGFPRTRPGALAQLAAIDQATLEGGSVVRAQQIIQAWVMLGGPTAESWSGVRAVADLLGAAGLPAAGSPALSVTASPELGLVRPGDASGEVVACVDFVVTATLIRASQIAVADCQRMQWSVGRWLIAAGPEPPNAPSVWPGTAAAQKVGYLDLKFTEGEHE